MIIAIDNTNYAPNIKSYISVLQLYNTPNTVIQLYNLNIHSAQFVLCIVFVCIYILI